MRVPLHSELDERMLLAGVALAKAVHDQVGVKHLAQCMRASHDVQLHAVVAIASSCSLRAMFTPTLQVQANGGNASFLLHRPVTLSVALASGMLFLIPGGLPLKDVCLSPYCVVERGEIARCVWV
jgi:hypothetical protein